MFWWSKYVVARPGFEWKDDVTDRALQPARDTPQTAATVMISSCVNENIIICAVRQTRVEPWSVPPQSRRCSPAEFWCQPPVRAPIQSGEVDPGRAPRGVGVRLAPACRNYQQLPASWGQLWLRLLTSFCGQRTASSHLEVESDSKSDCWQKQSSFIYIRLLLWLLVSIIYTSGVTLD